jgi:YVTN family beta-propeller protein
MRKKAGQFDLAKTNISTPLGLLFVVVFLVSAAWGQHFAYISNQGGMDEVQDDLSIIDLTTNTVVATVPVGHLPQGVAVNPAGTAVYVANTLGNDFTVIDTITRTATSFPAGLVPVGATIHPDGTRIYIANVDFFNEGESTISVVDRATNAVVDEIVCGSGSITAAVHPDGKLAYVPNTNDGAIAVFDTDTHEVLDTIVLEPAGADELCAPVPTIVHPDGTFVYVANRVGPTLWAINTATHEFTARAFGNRHVGIALNRAGTLLYLPTFDDSDPNLPPQGTTVDVIDTRTLELVTTIDGFNAPLDVSVHPDGTRLYVTNMGDNSVVVLDAATHDVIATVPVGDSPNAYGECVGPGVPRLLKQDAVARLEAVKVMIEADADGVVSSQVAIEHITAAIDAGNACLQETLWSADDAGQVDPRRLVASQGSSVFASEQTMVQAVLDTIRRGWITNADLRTELLAIADETVRADRVLAAVAIDDAIMAQAAADALAQAQDIMEQGDVLVKEAGLGPELSRRASLLSDAITQYQNAWEAALVLLE